MTFEYHRGVLSGFRGAPSIILGQILGQKTRINSSLPFLLQSPLPSPSLSSPKSGKIDLNFTAKTQPPVVYTLLWADELLVDTMNPYGAPPGASPPRGHLPPGYARPPRGHPIPGYVHVNLYFCDTFVFAQIFDGGLSKEAFFVSLFSGACCYLLGDSI